MALERAVAILVLNCNGKKFLGDCLTSLEKTSWPKVVYLVDNGSTDGSVEYVRENFPRVEVIQHDRNYGFCEGYNRAIRLIDEDYILLLNNDTEIVDPEWLGNMMTLLLEEDRVGVVGAKIVSMENPELLDAVGGKVWRWVGIGVRIGTGERDRRQYDNPPIEPFCVLGAAMLTRRGLFLDTGGFDSSMFSYSEELDLCWRLRLRGYKVKYCPTAVVRHHSSGSWNSMKILKLHLSSRNFLRSSLKNYSSNSLFRETPRHLATQLVGAFAIALLARNPRVSMALMRGIAWNLANLRETMKERTVVQGSRVTDEKQIIAAMGEQRLTDAIVALSQLGPTKSDTCSAGPQ